MIAYPDSDQRRDEAIRLEALRLAVQAGDPHFRHQFYDFLTGASDQTPRQIIDAALDAVNVR
jgi:hypothetical protein